MTDLSDKRNGGCARARATRVLCVDTVLDRCAAAWGCVNENVVEFLKVLRLLSPRADEGPPSQQKANTRARESMKIAKKKQRRAKIPLKWESKDVFVCKT